MHLLVFFSIYSIIKFIFEKVIVFLLRTLFMLLFKNLEILFVFFQRRFWHQVKRCWHLFWNLWAQFSHGLSHLFLIRILYSNDLICSWHWLLTYLMRILYVIHKTWRYIQSRSIILLILHFNYLKKYYNLNYHCE